MCSLDFSEALERMSEAVVGRGLAHQVGFNGVLILTMALVRIELHGEDPAHVHRQLRELFGIGSGPQFEVLKRRSSGASIRQIADATGLSRSSIHRMLSQATTA